MIYYALKSFSGKISMAAGEKRELTDKNLIADLLKSGYIAEFVEDSPKKEKSKKKRGEEDEQY